jgi:hypothetical protein
MFFILSVLLPLYYILPDERSKEIIERFFAVIISMFYSSKKEERPARRLAHSIDSLDAVRVNHVGVGHAVSTLDLPDATTDDATLHHAILHRLAHGEVSDPGTRGGSLHGGHRVSGNVRDNRLKGRVRNAREEGTIHVAYSASGGFLSRQK